MSITKQTAGRRHTYTPELGDEICDRREKQTLREICADPDMPDRATLQRWLVEEEDFRERYFFLLQMRAEGLLADAYDIVANALSGCLEQVRGGKVVTLAGRLEFACDRLRCRIRCWVADQLIATTRRQPSLSSSARHLRRLRRRLLRRRRSSARRRQ